MKIKWSNKKEARLSLVLLSLVAVAPAKAQLLNGDFSQIGPKGNPVLVHVPGGTGWKESAAKAWYQWTVVPNSSTWTQIEPMGFLGDMLHLKTDAGAWAPAGMGNGFGQQFSVIPCAKASFMIRVTKGQVTGGLAKATGPFANFSTFTATGLWHLYTEVVSDPVIALDFETLSGPGGEYYVYNVQVNPCSPLHIPLKDLSGYLLVDPYYYIKNPAAPVVKIRVTNRSNLAFTGPFHLMVDRLAPGRELVNPDGNYLGSPFMTLGVNSLEPGQSVDVTLEFDPAPDGSIPTFVPRVMSGNI